jgi:hypothetical protein
MPETFEGFPAPYRPTKDFSAIPFNKADLDTEFENIGEALRHLTALVQALLRDDWSLLDGIVTPESLSSDTTAQLSGGGGNIDALTLLGNALSESGPATALTVAEVLALLETGFATQPEAEAGLVDDKLMSPLRVAQAIAALAEGGAGGMTGEVVAIAAAAYTVTGDDYGKTLLFTNGAGCVVTVPQTSTEAIALPFFCHMVNANGSGLTILREGADVLEGKGTTGPQSVTVEGGAVILYKRIAGAPNTWRLTGEVGSS